MKAPGLCVRKERGRSVLADVFVGPGSLVGTFGWRARCLGTMRSFLGWLHGRLTVVVVVVLLLVGGAYRAAVATADGTQMAIIQAVHDPGAPVNPEQTVTQARVLGAGVIRVIVPWSALAPDPSSATKPTFAATDPDAYAAKAWAPYDAIVRAAAMDDVAVDLVLSGGAPRWANGPGAPRSPLSDEYFAWKASASDYGQFVRAVAIRYDGHFTPPGTSSPLPDVKFWSIFEEPNFGQHLAPQAIDGSRIFVAPMLYRGLVNAGFRALDATGHARDTIVIGELAAHGTSSPANDQDPAGQPGAYGQTKPLVFIRALYCVDSHEHWLRGAAATHAGCPGTVRGSRMFRRRNPALFDASGFGDHAEPDNLAPIADGRSDPGFATLADLDRLVSTLQRMNRPYGSAAPTAIYNDEYGYITTPPARFGAYVSPATAADYDNWGEYISWHNPHVASYMAYLRDPGPTSPFASFDNGLETETGQPKPAYDAYRLPLYLPTVALSRHASVEVWGAARPDAFASQDGTYPQTVAIQLNDRTIRTVTLLDPGEYFDLHMQFPASGTIRLAYTYPPQEPFLPVGAAGSTVYSRTVRITVH
jgi:hypothetical protein